jgi:hypothetical protein
MHWVQGYLFSHSLPVDEQGYRPTPVGPFSLEPGIPSCQDKVSQGAAADGDGGGRIGLPDFEVWKSHFGDVSGSAGVAVPEPASSTLAAIVFFSAIGLLNRGPTRTVNVQWGG